MTRQDQDPTPERLRALRARIAAGLLAFPVTPFRPDLSLDLDGLARHIDWLAPEGAAALFVAGGTGEIFSLTPAEVARVTARARSVAGDLPVIAGAGGGTLLAIETARGAEAAGAEAVLLLPPYLVTGPEAGLEAHVRAVCRAVGIGVIVYSRDNARFATATLARLASDCPNLIGFKDGSGDLARVREITATLGDRLVCIGGMPTHELHAEAYRAAGVPTYSSAVFNFVPRLARAFHAAVEAGDRRETDRMIRDFFRPYAAIRDRAPGYAVAIVKAGLRAIGRDPGPVRPPLADLTREEQAMLAPLVEPWRTAA